MFPSRLNRTSGPTRLLDDLVVDRRGPLDHRPGPKPRHHLGLTRLADRASPGRIVEQAQDPPSQCAAVARRHHEPGFAIADGTRDTAYGRGNHRSAQRHRLEHDRAQSLLKRRQAEDIHRRQRVGKIRPVRQECHSATDPQLTGQPPQVRLLGTGSGHQELDVPPGGEHLLSGTQEVGQAFDRLERSGSAYAGHVVRFKNPDQPLGLRSIDTGGDHLHPVRFHAPAIHQGLADRFTGRHHPGHCSRHPQGLAVTDDLVHADHQRTTPVGRQPTAQ